LTTLEATIYSLRRSWRGTRTFIFTGAFAALVICGFFAPVPQGLAHRIGIGAIFALWSLFFGVKAKERFTRQERSAVREGRDELELGLLLVLAVHAGVQMTGGLSSHFYPAVFVLVAFLVVYTRQWVSFTLVAATIGIEFALVVNHGTATDITHALVHAVFIALFSLINFIFTRSEVTRIRLRAADKIAQAREQIEDDARAFRLTAAVNAGTVSREDEAERLQRCTVTEVRRAMYHHINLLKRTLKLHSCMLFWLDDKRTGLKLIECVSDSEDIDRRLYSVKEGILGGIWQSRQSLTLKELRPGYPGITYYQSGGCVTDFLGVPILEGAAARGILCGDRKDGTPFSDDERQIFAQSVESILQNVSNERVFVQLQKAKSEQSKLLRASETLSQALTEKDCMEAALDAASEIAPFDLAAVATMGDKRNQVIRLARGENADALTGEKVSNISGLVASAVKTRHFLPYRGAFEAGQQIVYNRKLQPAFEKMKSLLVLPLVFGDAVLGTLTIASQKPGVYTDEVRTTLQVMINQLGTTLQNATMVRQLEELATTDGLTGLPNHRSFQDELSRQIAQSLRFNSETSIILCDVDKFKGVNDTYGHPVGDMVLKALGDTLRRIVVRDTDMPARYGGEEFIIVCGGTGTEGAVQLAERLRQDLEGQVFRTDKGELRCTISMGVATFPAHSQSKEDLIERADLALYAAKEGGRNQVRVWNRGMRK